QRIARGAAVPAVPAEEPTIAAVTGIASLRDVRHEDRPRQRDAPAGGVVDGAAARRAASSAPAASTRVAAAAPIATGAARCISRAAVTPGSAIPAIAADRRQAAEAARRLVALA